MATDKDVAATKAAEAAAAKAAADKEAAKPKVTEVTVEWKGNFRTFSVADHGDVFMEKAKLFAKNYDGTIV